MRVANGGRTMEQPARIYENAAIAVEWYPERCLHTARCIQGLPDVFDPRRKPWIELGEHTADELAEVVERCPTGALHYRRLDGGPAEMAPEPVQVYAERNGPLYLRGQVTVEDGQGRVLREETRVALCRCGQSKRIPFCDNTHRLIGFTDPPSREEPRG